MIFYLVRPHFLRARYWRVAILLLFCVLLLFSFSLLAFAADSGSGGGFFSGLAQMIKNIFVPSPNYFHNKISTLNDHAKEKLGGVAYLYQMLNGFFRELQNVSPAQFNVSILGVDSMDFFVAAKPYLRLIRDVFTAFFCLVFAICCYHKLRSFFSD